MERLQRGAPRPADDEAHEAAPGGHRRSEDEAVDLLAPLERGGKAGLFGGAGVGKTAPITGRIVGPDAALRRRPARLRECPVLDPAGTRA